MGYFRFPNYLNYDSDLDSDLGWLIKATKQLVECCEEMTKWKEQHEQEYQELKTLYDQVMSGTSSNTGTSQKTGSGTENGTHSGSETSLIHGNIGVTITADFIKTFGSGAIKRG